MAAEQQAKGVVSGNSDQNHDGPKQIAILGIRGIPAQHGGFETFAEGLAGYLQTRGWGVTVYCQEQGTGSIHADTWRGISRVLIPVKNVGTLGTIIFDWKATWHARKVHTTVLTLGYNTAVFFALYRLGRVKNVLNMDGIEWRRGKWGLLARAWFRLNERLGAWLGNCLVADHPEIAKHLESMVRRRKICMIPYTADVLASADEELLLQFGLGKGGYVLVVARAEKENSILEVVSAFSRRPRGVRLVVLGRYEPDKNEYQRHVLQHASDEVAFVGAIYDKETVQALRFHARLYVHGHTVGGTNPSLVEALGAGSAVLAHDNVFNRWVAGEEAHYFAAEEDCAREFDSLLANDPEIRAMQTASRRRMVKDFTAEKVYGAYQQLLRQWQ